MRNYGALTYTEGPAMYFSAVVIITSFLAGSMLVMWMGEQIDNKGIGNGISMILFAGIVSRASSMVNTVITELYLAINGIMKYWFIVPFTLVLFLAAIVFIVIMTNAERRIPVQYAQRVVGRKMYGGQSTHIPIKGEYVRRSACHLRPEHCLSAHHRVDLHRDPHEGREPRGLCHLQRH